ncbi:hypothetical protein QAD02_005383 [Eretmocerus hayati]|uniref:Uncharacterized protein n=1 Tax=Eretmocerus hayati TaxID=131215 RepID=A0ACC2NSK2_9HYME|nr:hypothetical protein QAD02_005383 [Eretmocerus hayati]
MTSTEHDIKWAIDLLTPEPDYEENFLSKNYPWIFWPTVTVGGCAYVNWFMQRPVYAGLPRYGLAAVAGIVLAKVFKDAKYHRESERDQVLRHYIKLHPEDFPPPVRTTYNDEFRDWVPCR